MDVLQVPPKLLTPYQAARRLNLSEEAVRRKIREGDLPAYKLGPGPRSPLRIPADELERWLERNRTDSRARPASPASAAGPPAAGAVEPAGEPGPTEEAA